MEQLKEVQADKRGTEDDVEDKLTSATAENEESIRAIKLDPPGTNDNKVTNDGVAKDDETELKTATKETNTDSTIVDTDSYYTKGMYKITRKKSP